jgi:transposase
VSAATAVRFSAEHRNHGAALPKPQGRPAGQFGKRAPHRGFLQQIVQAEPDITLKELAAALSETYGVEFSFPRCTALSNAPGCHVIKD